MTSYGANPRRYAIDLPVFSGPLDLLLHLIERQELDITAISLTRVTEQYLQQVEQLRENRVEHLIDFLVIGARLVLIKSRALLPQNPVVIAGEEEEEDPAEALMRQLRQYRRFKHAAAWLQDRVDRGLRTYLRLAPPPRLEGKLDLSGVTVQTLCQALRDALNRIEDLEETVQLVQPRRITIEGQIERLRGRLRAGDRVQFGAFLSPRVNRVEVTVTLLALLELIKRREAAATQTELFGLIEVSPVTGDQQPSRSRIRQDSNGRG